MPLRRRVRACRSTQWPAQTPLLRAKEGSLAAARGGPEDRKTRCEPYVPSGTLCRRPLHSGRLARIPLLVNKLQPKLYLSAIERGAGSSERTCVEDSTNGREVCLIQGVEKFRSELKILA